MNIRCYSEKVFKKLLLVLYPNNYSFFQCVVSKLIRINMKTIYGLIFILITSANVFAQDAKEKIEDTTNYSIPQYDKLCTIMGGDSIRYNLGNKATGQFKDYYPDGKLKHKGYYDNGKIVTVFTNYYEDGKVERNFKAKSDTRGTLEVFYRDGILMSRVEWINGESLKWEDFFPSGKPEFAEEFNSSLEYYLYMHFYYENSNPKVLFELTDKKSRTYSYKEFYENGQLEETGNKVHNLALDDYQMDGKWSYYDETGKLVLEEEYVRGQLVSDKKY
jgi:antitoxin component YwqK of YwqJK toxin-antitoxin module